MKILVFSDSHGDVRTMVSVCEHEKPGLIMHLGDHYADAEQLSYEYTKAEIVKVPGNTDFGVLHSSTKMHEVCGKRIMLTHGHAFDVKSGDYAWLLQAGKERSADIILFGHTHVPYMDEEDGVMLMNPGRIGRNDARRLIPTYIVIDLSNADIKAELRRLTP